MTQLLKLSSVMKKSAEAYHDGMLDAQNVLILQVAFLKYPPDIGSVVPIAMATHVAGVVVFYSPELSYKLGQATGLDPLLCTYVGMAFSFLVVVLLPFITR